MRQLTPRKILLILVDALPFHKFNANVRKHLGRGWRYSRLESILGYSDCFKVSLFTGCYPDSTGYWMKFIFSENTKYQLPGLLNSIDYIPTKMKVAFRLFLTRVLGEDMPIHMIPCKAMPFLDRTLDTDIEKCNHIGKCETLFSILKKNRISWNYLTTVKCRNYNLMLKKVKMSVQSNAVTILYMDELDYWGHRLGTESSIYNSILENVVDFVRLTIKKACSNRSNFRTVVFSDHGMISTPNHINLWNDVIRDKMFGKDYIFFLDATTVRAYYLNDKETTKDRVGKIIERRLSKHARDLSLDEMRKKRLPITRKYGDRIWLLEPGYVLYPNFMSWLPPWGMHAYDPSHPSQTGLFAYLGNEEIDTDIVRPTDIMPMILENVGVSIPKTCEGKNPI